MKENTFKNKQTKKNLSAKKILISLEQKKIFLIINSNQCYLFFKY